MRGGREAITGNDRARVVQQQFVCVGFVKVLVAQFSGHVKLRGDSESTKSRVGYRLGDTQTGNRLAVACTHSPFRLLYLSQMCPQGSSHQS